MLIPILAIGRHVDDVGWGERGVVVGQGGGGVGNVDALVLPSPCEPHRPL